MEIIAQHASKAEWDDDNAGIAVEIAEHIPYEKGKDTDKPRKQEVFSHHVNHPSEEQAAEEDDDVAHDSWSWRDG